MSRFLMSASVASIVASGLALSPTPASAQDSSGEQIGYVIVYGDDPCPRSSDSEIVVCARKPETERYRIPQRYRDAGPRQTRESWALRAKSFEYVGQTGTMSCSAVGPGGFTGCLQNMIDRAKADASGTAAEGVPPPEDTPPGY